MISAPKESLLCTLFYMFTKKELDLQFVSDIINAFPKLLTVQKAPKEPP